MRASRLRTGGALLAAALTVAACSGDSEDGVATGPTLRLDPTTTAPARATDGPGALAPSPASPGGSPSGGPPPASGKPAPPGGGAGSAAVLPSDAGPPGSFAPGYLRPEPATAVVVEVSAQDGATPRDDTLPHLVSRLESVTGKGILVDGPVGFSDSRRSWTADAIRRVAADRARVAQGGGRAVMRLLLLRGEFEQADVIGVAVQGAVMAVFVDAVRRASSPISGADRIEKAVTLHEAGHLLGLVDLYLSTGRQDPEHPGHSRNEGSVMFWAVESSLVGELLGGGPPVEFDQRDRQDLAAIARGAGPGSG